MPTKKQKRSSSINGKKFFEMKESNLKINRKINLELVTHTVLRSLKKFRQKGSKKLKPETLEFYAFYRI